MNTSLSHTFFAFVLSLKRLSNWNSCLTYYKKATSSVVLLVVFILLFLFPFLVTAQQDENPDPKLVARVDSLITTLINANTAAEKIEIEQQVHELSESIGYREGIMNGKINLIAGLNALGKSDQALKLVDGAIKEAIKFDSPSYTIQLLSLKASCYSTLGLFDEGRTALNLAKSYAFRLQDNNEYHYALGNIADKMSWNIEAAKGNPDSILFYLKNSSQHYSKLSIASKDNIYQFNISNRIGHTYFEKEQYDSAYKYLSYLHHVKEEYLKSTQSGLFTIYFTDARLAYISKDYQKAAAAYKNALGLASVSKLPYYQKRIYKDLTQLYHQIGDHQQEASLLKRYTVITDSLNQMEKKAMREPLEDIINDKNSATNKSHSLYVYIGLVLVILVAGLIFFYRHLKGMKRQKVAREETLDEPLSSQSTNDDDLHNLIELAKQNSPTLYVRFNEFDPTFCKRLLAIDPNLLVSEQELCIYIRLNLDTKKIARYANLSVKAVQAKKHRIRKKLGIHPKEDMTNWIINL